MFICCPHLGLFYANNISNYIITLRFQCWKKNGTPRVIVSRSYRENTYDLLMSTQNVAVFNDSIQCVRK